MSQVQLLEEDLVTWIQDPCAAQFLLYGRVISLQSTNNMLAHQRKGFCFAGNRDPAISIIIIRIFELERDSWSRSRSELPQKITP